MVCSDCRLLTVPPAIECHCFDTRFWSSVIDERGTQLFVPLARLRIDSTVGGRFGLVRAWRFRFRWGRYRGRKTWGFLRVSQ